MTDSTWQNWIRRPRIISMVPSCIARTAPRTYNWPVPYSRGDGESDTPDHCGKCSRFLGRNLTSDGIAYVEDHAREELDRDGVIGEVVQGWLDEYGIVLDGDSA